MQYLENYTQDVCQFASDVEKNFIWDEYKIRPGVKLVIQNVSTLGAPLCFNYEIFDSPVQLLYCISGNAKISIKHINGTKLYGRIISKQCSISYVPDTRGTAVAKAGCPLKSITLLIDHEMFHCLAHQAGEYDRDDFSNLFSGKINNLFYKEFALPLPLEIIARQILECPLLNKGMKKIFLEYKAMELFYNQLSLLDFSGEEHKKVTCNELEAAQRAHSMLLQDLSSPPSLLCLAKKVGLTHTKLNKVFKLVYHNTVFGVLRMKRLECAKALLADSRKSVAEVAYECGFATPSHLSRAFLEQYGIQPKRYQAELASSTFLQSISQDEVAPAC